MAGKIIVFANQKGGVGKTTSAASLGAYMAESGKRILLVDFDPQANLTSSFGIDGSRPGIYELLTEQVTISAALQPTLVENLSIIPSNINLTGANVELISEQNRETFLKRRIQPILSEWDYVLVDCPPSLGLLTLNGLVAADFVLIPLQCEYFALEGLSLLLKTIQRVQQSANPHLEVGGIIFTMYDPRTKLAHEVVEEVTGYFKEKVFRTIIPRNVRLSEAPSHGLPINKYDAECIGAKSYQKLSAEVLSRV